MKKKETVAEVMERIAKMPVVVVARRAKEIEAVDLAAVDVAKFRHDHPSSNSGMIALLKSRSCTRHELLGFLMAVYYKKGEQKTAASRLSSFLGNKTPRKGCYVDSRDGVYSIK